MAASFALRPLAALTAAVVMISVCSVHVARAASANEYALLQQIPAAVLDTVTNNAEPDSNGAMQLNRQRWTDIVYQRIAIPLIWVGAVENDTAKIDDGWKAIDFANAHMTADGGFSTAPGRTMNESEMAMWIEAVAHALTVLNESPLKARYASRSTNELGYLRKNVDWLNTSDRVAALLRFDTPATNRLFVDAAAFGYASYLLNDPSLRDRAQFFLDHALAQQRSDGAFVEERGFDSSYQGVSLLHATYVALLLDDANLRSALLSGTHREVAAIGPGGNVDTSQNTRTGGTHTINGQPYGIDTRSLVLGLYYAGIYLPEPDAVAAAKRVFARAFHQPAP